MKSVKQTLLRVFFGVEIVIFAGMYLFGAQGIRVVHRLRRENKKIEYEVRHLQEEVKELETLIVAGQADSFYKEKIARERLHMARKNDVIFCLD